MAGARINVRSGATIALALVGSLLVGSVVHAQGPAPSPASSGAPATLDAEVQGIIGQVQDLRGLADTSPIPWRLLGAKEAMDDQLGKVQHDPKVVDRAAQDGRIYTRLGLLPAGTDLLQLTLDTLRQQVAGYYDPDTQQLTVIDADGQLDVASRITLAHESDHALQDRRWGLDKLTGAIDPLEEDQLSAVQALIEGDATLLMSLWAARYAAGDLMGDLSGAGLPGTDQLAGLPQVIQRQLLFPYLDGLTFLFRQWGPRGWDGVNAVWDAPPVSTEQMMHPERYPDELPVPVTLPDLAATLGDGWAKTGETVMGELNTSIFVADGAPWDALGFSLSGQRMPNAEAADGWGGDRIVTLDGPDGTWVLAWQTTWDTPKDADEFAAAATAALADLPAASAVSRTDLTADGLPAPVLVLVADSAATLATAQAALGGAPT